MTDTPPRYVPYVPGPENAPTSPMSPPPAWTTTFPIQQPPAHQPASNGKAVLVGVAAALVVIFLAAGGIGAFVLLREGKDPVSAVVGAQSFTLSGALVLTRGYGGTTACSGTGGLADIATSAQIAVSDAAGTTIALGRLDPGVVIGAGCTFTFRIANVPGNQDFYGVEVTRRGVVKYTRDEAMSGRIQLTLG